MKPYRELTWIEVGEAAAKDPVVLIPIGTLEDHGPHLPIDTDVVIGEEICRRVAQRMPEETVLFPAVVHGYSPHHRDFPGSINIRWDVFINHLLDQTRSLVGHGFRRMLMLNAHGSNNPLVEMAARQTVVEHPHVLCGKSYYLTSPRGRAAIKQIRESEYPGGMAHACELETSIYLAIRPELVRMDLARKRIEYPPSEQVWFDWEDGPLSLMEYWSTLSSDGTMGDPTLATPEKGQILLEAAVEEIGDYIRAIKQREIRERVDHHGVYSASIHATR